MKHRILLVTNKSTTRSVTKGVDVADLNELSATLAKVGAVRVACYWRDRIGDGHTEGAPFPVADLNPKHFDWLITGPKDAARALFYEPKS